MSDMGTCIGRLALSQDFSDVQIIVGQEREVFPAHRLILAARSEYFRKMFYGVQMKEAKEAACSFPDDDPTVFKTMLYHLYERPLEFTLEPRHVALCLMTSEKYRIETFRSFCIRTLEALLSIDTVCEIASLLEDLSETTLTSLIQPLVAKYIFDHLEEIVQTEAHFALSQSLLERILQNPYIKCNETSLFKAVTSWHMHHYESFQTDRALLLQNLKLLDLRAIELQDMAAFVHQSGVFTAKEMADLYKTRINLQHFGHSSRFTRKCGIMFHAGQEYTSRTVDVVNALRAAGMEIDPRDVLNFGDAPTESVTRLMEYSSLLVFSMETRLKGSCGDLLADYVDRGGCIVLCHALGCISGRIMTEKYLPVKRTEPFEGDFKHFHLGKIMVDKHPLFTGVKKLKVRCGPNFVWNCEPMEDTNVLAEWDDGTLLACERQVGRGKIVFLNLYPVSTRLVLVGLDKDCDGHILSPFSVVEFLRNALLYTAYNPTAW